MNNIGVGIFCFGDTHYFNGAKEKISNLKDYGIPVYILTDTPDAFREFKPQMIIKYDRSKKSYYDKMILPKYILKNHDITILIDADTYIKDYSIFDQLKTYSFKSGVTYIDTLLNHSAKREYVKHLLNNEAEEWLEYVKYAKTLYPEFGEFKTAWEYFLVINKDGFNSDLFYNHYENLQLAKEFSDLRLNKKVIGAGEGISINIAGKLSNTNVEYDETLHNMLKDRVISISKAHTPPNEWPNWMR